MTAMAKTNWRKRRVRLRITSGNGVEEELVTVEVGRALKRLKAILLLGFLSRQNREGRIFAEGNRHWLLGM